MFSHSRLPEASFNYFVELLPMPMQQPIRRYLNWEDAQLALFGKLLLKEAFKRAGLEDNAFNAICYTEFNRPWIEDIDFNISHSGSIVMCAWSKRKSIGIDVEKIKPIPIEDFNEQFSVEELAFMTNATDPLNEFYTGWTKKEAIIKAHGKGLSLPLKNIIFVDPFHAITDNRKWYIVPIPIAPGYQCHLAADFVLPENIMTYHYKLGVHSILPEGELLY